MLALPVHGFVLLSLTKCGSTSLEDVRALRNRARVALRHEAPLKHATYAQFEQYVEPLLAIGGWAREDYEVAVLVRDPLDWLVSWWRFRSRAELLEDGRRHRWVGDLGFEEFADGFLDGRLADDPVDVRPSAFVADRAGRVGVDRVFALGRPDLWHPWLEERLGTTIEVPRRNESTERRGPGLVPEVEARLRARMADDQALWDRVADAGEWRVPRDARPPAVGGTVSPS